MDNHRQLVQGGEEKLDDNVYNDYCVDEAEMDGASGGGIRDRYLSEQDIRELKTLEDIWHRCLEQSLLQQKENIRLSKV